jgi:uncharacterized membrane protein YfcA
MDTLIRAGWVNQLFGIIWVFGWVVLFVVLKMLSDMKKRHRMDLLHKERMAAMEKGIPVHELPEYEVESRMPLLSRVSLNPRWPLGVGAIFAFLGIGLSLALWLSGDSYHNQVWPFGLLGVFLGIGLFLHYLLTKEPK